MVPISEHLTKRLLIREERLFDAREKLISKSVKHAKKKIAFVSILSRKQAKYMTELT
jgi:hypothetical protein